MITLSISRREIHAGGERPRIFACKWLQAIRLEVGNSSKGEGTDTTVPDANKSQQLAVVGLRDVSRVCIVHEYPAHGAYV